MENLNPELEEVKQKAAELDAEGGSLMEPTPPKKSKRGRPKKEKSEFSGKKENPEKSQQDESPKADMVKPIIRNSVLPLISNAAADFAGDPRAAMAPGEMDVMTDLMCALLDKYAPNALGRFGLEITTVAFVGQYAYRVHKLRQLTKAHAETTPRPPRAEPAPEPQPDHQPKFEVVEKAVDFGEMHPDA